MLELFIEFIESLTKGDQQFRKPLKNVISRYDQLVADPAGYLDAEEVRIRPGNRIAIALVLGSMSGLILSCGAFVSTFSFPIFAKRPFEEYLAILLIAISGPVVAIGAFLYWLRGGEIILHKDRIDFRFRHRTVTCPWNLFHVRGDPAWLDSWTLALPVNPQARSDVKLIHYGEVVDSGKSIATKQFRFRSDSRERVTNAYGLPEVALRDLYSAKLMEIGGLILILGSKLGTNQSYAESESADSTNSGV